MRESTIKEKVLKKIRNALIDRNPNPNAVIDQESNVFPEFNEEPELYFAHQFSEVGGKFIYCGNLEELYENIRLLLNKHKVRSIVTAEPQIAKIARNSGAMVGDQIIKDQTNIAITGCEFLVARFGSIALSSYENRSRQIWPMADVHVVIADSSQVQNELKDGFDFLLEKYDKQLPSQITFMTGPSRTADIEKTLVLGAHGPAEVYVLYIDEF